MENRQHERRPQGGDDEITTRIDTPAHDPAPRAAAEQSSSATSETPEHRAPLTFADAEQRNPYSLLIDLHDHALDSGRRSPDATHHLAELALSAAVVTWWSRWQPIIMHRALAAGADFAEIAEAAGVSEAEVRERWSSWADQQTRLFLTTGIGLDPAEATAIRARRSSGP